MTVKISEEKVKEKAVFAFRFFGSKCGETVRTSTQSFFDLRVKMLVEMLDRLTTIVGSHSNIKKHVGRNVG